MAERLEATRADQHNPQAYSSLADAHDLSNLTLGLDFGAKPSFSPRGILSRGKTDKGGGPMLRDRYAPMNLFDHVPALGMMVDPVLMQLDTPLDHDILLQTVKADLARRFPYTPATGRPSTPVEVILRLLVVKHLYGWSDEQTEQFVADSLVLRQVCRVYAERVPADTRFIRWANLIQPATLHRLLDQVVAVARSKLHMGASCASTGQ